MPAASWASSSSAAAGGGNAVPQERQNWASSLFSVPHTEHSFVIPCASEHRCRWVEGRYLGLQVGAISLFVTNDNAPTLPRRSETSVLYASLKAIHLLGVVVW